MAGTDLRSKAELAALALRRGDPLTAMSLTDRETMPVALAIRGAALAQLDEPGAAAQCLIAASRAATRAGDRDTAARAELALAELDLAARDFDRALERLDGCAGDLAGDGGNVAFLEALRARIEVYRGRPAEAASRLARASAPDPFGLAILALARAEAALACGDVASCQAHLGDALRHAREARHGFLLAEIETGRDRLNGPAARVIDASGERVLTVLELASIRAGERGTLVDELLRTVRVGRREVRLATRPLLFAILRRLAAAHPDVVDRDELVLALGVHRSNEAHRATLRVEIARLRPLLPEPADVVASGAGFRLAAEGPLVRLAPLAGHPASDVAALLTDGRAWRADDVARALGASPRSAQRHLAALRESGVARTVGAGRAARWVSLEAHGFTFLGQLSALWAIGGDSRGRDRATDVARTS